MSGREQFEADWVRRNGVPINNRMRDDGRYGVLHIQAEWEEWQAARAQPAQAVPLLSVMEAIHIGAKHSTGLSHTREFTEDGFLACVAEIEQAVRSKLGAMVPMTRSELVKLSQEYADLENEEEAFRDGWRRAERHHGIVGKEGGNEN
jgi:hypothetical protein